MNLKERLWIGKGNRNRAGNINGNLNRRRKLKEVKGDLKQCQELN